MSQYKFEVGQAVQVSPKANTKHAGKFGTIKSRSYNNNGYWASSRRTYTIALADGSTSELVEASIRKATQSQVAGNTPDSAKKDHMVVSTDYSVVGIPMTFGEAVECAKKMQLSTPDSPNYMVVKIVTMTTTPKTIVEMKDC